MRRIIQTPPPGVMVFNGTNTKITGSALGWAGAQAHTFAVWCKWFGTAGGSSPAITVGESVLTKSPFVGVSANKFGHGNYGSAIAERPAVKNDWKRLVGTYNGTNGKVFLNGAAYCTASPYVVNINTSVPYLGDFAGGGYPWAGFMWQAKIWNRVLSDDEIALDFFEGKHITSGLVRYWPLEVLSGGKTPELIGGTLDTVANGAINSTDLPFKARTAV